jgi:hypothetical protein
MSLARIIDSPLVWTAAGFSIGLGLGVNSASMWLMAAGTALFVVYLRWHGPARPSTEGLLFSGGPAFILAWVVGFVVHGLAF